MTTPRSEYPRPQFVRDSWLNLNGEWTFEFDDDSRGLADSWHAGREMARRIVVPFAFQAELSGIHERAFHDCVWYQRRFAIPAAWDGKRVLLHVGAADYRAWVWINGQFAAFHEGGHTPFNADITPFLRPGGEQTIVIRVEDNSTDRTQPRGKQYWEVESAAIFYTRTTGIWQTVWLEPVAEAYFDNLMITPSIDDGTIRIAYHLGGSTDSTLEIETEIGLNGQRMFTKRHAPTTQQFPVEPLQLWSPDSPTLYDLNVRLLRDGVVVDEVRSYFGMRKISVEGGRVLLNNQPYTMRLVLDQGYHPQGVLTFPDDEAYKLDITLTKQMGFNGARKHQKVEDPRYLYWADRLGLLVWGEMANCYDYSEAAVQRTLREWQEAVLRDYNHPCIVAWVPLNESWGVPDLKNDSRQRAFLQTLYHATRALDPTRPVISNDGWEHAVSDLCTIHDYTGSGAVLRTRYSQPDSALSFRPADRPIYAPTFQHHGEPLLVTEFGGIAFERSEWKGWGYNQIAASEEEFISRYADVVHALLESPLVQGFCYTQLTDVEQEINGLLTYDRRPKAPVEAIRQITAAQRA